MRSEVCIIGGGPTGVAVAKELNDAGISHDLYEEESDFGGTWNSTAGCGRVYDSTHLISSKNSTQFPDYPMPEHYPAYPRHDLMLNYIRAFAKRFGVYENSQFNKKVTKLTLAGDEWDVTLSSEETRRYSFVCVCNGLQRIACYPDPSYPGYFTGQVMHSIDYKRPSQLVGERVLVIGAGNSGCDIAVDAVHRGKTVYHSTRRGYYYQPKFINGKPTPDWMMEIANKFRTRQEVVAYIKQVFKMAGYDGADYGLPRPDYSLDAAHPIMNSHILYYIGHGDIHPKPDISSFQGCEVIFRDGTKTVIDLIIYATGYHRHFPFLDSGHLKWHDDVPDLFIHIAPRDLDNIFFLGFVNSATGLGNLAKTSGLVSAEYVRARREKTRGYSNFIKAKREDNPDVGQGQYISSRRHLWEVDLWKFLKTLNQYRAMLAER